MHPTHATNMPIMTLRQVIITFGHLMSFLDKLELEPHTEFWYCNYSPEERLHEGKNGHCVAPVRAAIAYRYEIISELGSGAYSTVYKALDHKTSKMVAIKIIKKQKAYLNSYIKETSVLDELMKLDPDESHNFVHLRDTFSTKGYPCIVYDMHHNDLYTEMCITYRRKNKSFPLDKVPSIAKNVLECLDLMASNKIIHCDLKSENIILAAEGSFDVKVIEFGLARFSTENQDHHIQSRYYRSPEVALCNPYGCAIDMWSLGCIVFELATGKPLFKVSHDEYLITDHVELIGMPSNDFIEKSNKADKFFKWNPNTGTYELKFNKKDWRGRICKPKSRQIRNHISGKQHKHLIDFVMRCLTWNPDDRMTPRDALDHPYIRGLSEPGCKGASKF